LGKRNEREYYKLIRRFIPKGTDISKVSKAKIKSIERWINEYPRRMFWLLVSQP